MTQSDNLSLLLILMFSVLTAHELTAQQPVKIHESARIGGIKQWIGATGKDDSKPLLLFLHGGPGFSSRAYSKKFIKYLKKDFIVAQWDQRETGITKHWSPSTYPITLDLFHEDTEEVIRYLLQKFSKDKLYLVGFSWGGFLGLNFTKEHPELLHAYVHVSGMVHQMKSEELTVQLLRKKALESEKQTQDEIAEIRIPFESWEQLYYQRKWTASLLGNASSKRAYPKALFESWSAKWMPLFIEASKINYFEQIQEIHCPIYFFASRQDYVANHLVTQSYYEQVKADHKRIIWFEQSSHEIPSDEPKKFSEELIRLAKPFVE